MRKGLLILIILCLTVGTGLCSRYEFKTYLQDKLRKHSDRRFIKTKIKDEDNILTYSIIPRNNIVKKDELIAKIVDARPLKNYKDDSVVTADKSAQSEYSYYFHSVKDDYLYVLFLRKKVIPTFDEDEDPIEDTTHKVLVIPLKGFLKDRGSVTLSYYESPQKAHVVINDDYHILLQLRNSDELKVQFKKKSYQF